MVQAVHPAKADVLQITARADAVIQEGRRPENRRPSIIQKS